MPETFKAAKDRILAELKEKGWSVSAHLKIPHATSPSGDMRFWFKPQAVYATVDLGPRPHHDFSRARSLHEDLRGRSASELIASANRFMGARVEENPRGAYGTTLQTRYNKLDRFLKEEGILGFTSKIVVAYDAGELDDYLQDEGIIGYTERIRGILSGRQNPGKGPHPTTSAIEALRTARGDFPTFTSVGSYPIIYLAGDGAVLCADCVNGKNGSEVGSDDALHSDGSPDKQWTVVAGDVYWEGPDTQCDHCSDIIESAYGDPEEEGGREDDRR